MPDTISLLGVISALLLPWIFGGICVFTLLRKTGRWNVFLITGQGYLLGIFATTLIMRLWNTTGLPLQFGGIAGVLLALTSILVGYIYFDRAPTRAKIRSQPLQSWQWVVTAVLLALIAMRYATLVQEIILRPLFPWDAWMNWAPKAIVWFHYEDMVPFVSPQQWLSTPASALSYTEGAGKAWSYPITVPLVQLWGMLGMGTSDNTLIYLPWFFVAIAMGLALFGHLRLRGVSLPAATLACYALLNLPFINVHVALAGYADIWVAAAFGCAVFALQEWGESRQWPYALLALVLALMCTQLKVPGLIMGGIVGLVFLTSIIRLNKIAWLAMLATGLVIAVFALTTGINIALPGIGRVALSADGIVLPYIGQYDLAYHSIHKAMGNTLFLMLNWNILWYVFVWLGAYWLLAHRDQGVRYYVPSLTLRALIMALLFIFFVYYFTNRYQFVLDFSQINRALIYTIPVMVFYVFSRVAMYQRERPGRVPYDQ